MIFAAGFVIAFIILLFWNRKNKDRRLCRWREYRQNGGTTWTCVHCGASTEGVPGQTPTTCLRPRGEAP
ncbi:hypothetical protein KO516_08630 [Citreicella sp. C3M06]|uniref:hypothetical protein n=1 Tax=Citreicella sp. C3M06 TaxID=2841564 RepID=UPI001C093C37|nr:hypothetical protein [Citreicella sp. C3M06]MBU2960878.1 hypothetical protein [Citreicella sp. C3M06]